MKVCVLGGGGLIGNAIVRALLTHEHEVTAVGRRREAPLNMQGLRANYLAVDTSTAQGLEAAIRGQDAVVDAAAPYPLYLSDPGQGTRRDREHRALQRTDQLLETVSRHDARFVYIGTTMAKPRASTGNVMDLPGALARTLHPYFSVKRQIDAQVSAALDDGLRGLIIQPTVCVGPWDSKSREQCWVPALINGQIRVGVQHEVNVVDTRDVAEVTVAALAQDLSGAPLVVAGHNLSVRDLFAEFCAAANVRAPRWSVPAALGILPGLWTELAYTAVGMRSPLPALIPLLICEQQPIAPARGNPPAGIVARPLRETVRDTIAWYRHLGYCQP